MNKKTLRDIAIGIIIVFGITVIVYPTLFGPDKKTAAEPLPELQVHK